MSRISRKFAEIKGHKAKAFIPYIMAGDPDLSRTRDMVRLIEDNGGDILELGVPFSDPLADGPTIQMAAQRALAGGTRLRSVLEFVSLIRKDSQIPVILMTYYNPVFRYGEKQFVADASSAGVDGIIVPDLPPEEAGTLIEFSRKADFDTIFLLAPTSTEDRIRKVASVSRGFIYYVSITGITGAKLKLEESVASHVAEIRKVSNTPMAIGFGISTPEDAESVCPFFDGVIVGSAIVKKMSGPAEDMKKYLISLREAIR